MNKIFSKPVLYSEIEENSFYCKNIEFEINFIETNIHNDLINLIVQYNLTSDTLNKLMENGKARLYFKVKTSLKSFFHSGEFRNSQNTITFNKNICQRLDKIELSAYIICEDDIDVVYNDEFDSSVFDKDFIFKYKKGDLLALSNSLLVHYSMSGEPFINLRLAESQEGKGMLFSAEGSNVIEIKVGKKFNDAYSKLQHDKIARDVLNPFLAFNAILYSILYISNPNNYSEEYVEKKWFQSLESCFSDEKYENLNEFILEMRNDYDINEIYRVCQKILNNQLEEKIVNTGRRGR